MIRPSHYAWSCYITWRSDGDGSNFQITSVSCQTWELGGGGGGSGGGNSPAAQDNDKVSEKCKKDIENVYGTDFLNKALEVMKNPPLIDIEAMPSLFEVERPFAADDMGSRYFGSRAGAGESLGKAFDRQGVDAYAIQGYGVDGIYYRGSRTSFVGRSNFLFHEIIHTIQKTNRPNTNLDTELVDDLGISRSDGLSDTQLVSRYFNSGCNSKFGGPL